MLRWTSLVLSVAVLAALGGARTHLHNFTLFLVVLLGLAALIAVVFVATATGNSRE